MNKKKFDVVALGELLIDFTAKPKTSPESSSVFEQNPGGAPANVVCALSTLCKSTTFIGKVGCDMHGEFLRDTLEKKGVDTTWLYSDEKVFTTLAFVDISDKGERKFSFARKPGADTYLSPEEIRQECFADASIFHFGSLSLTDEPVRSATFKAIKYAKDNGMIISYDPNYRASLWKDEDTASQHMKSVLEFVDIIKISDEEAEILTGEKDLHKAAKQLLKIGIKSVAITMAEKGASFYTKNIIVNSPALACNVVDTTGAGDAFWGAFLFFVLENNTYPWDFDSEQAKKCLEFANKAATICIGKTGAIKSMPTLDEITNINFDNTKY